MLEMLAFVIVGILCGILAIVNVVSLLSSMEQAKNYCVVKVKQ